VTIDPWALRHPELGWRFHLSLNARQPHALHRFEACAQRLLAQRSIAGFRFGSGGITAAPDSSRVTVFAGDLLNAVALAAELEYELSGLLLPTQTSVMRTHLPMTPTGRSWARFATNPHPENRFSDEGARGICFLKADSQPAQWGGEPDPEIAHRNALLALQAEYRSFFAGPNFELGDIIERGRRVEREGSRAIFGWDPTPEPRQDLGLDVPARAWWEALPGRGWRRNGHSQSRLTALESVDPHGSQIDLP
jgi:hypothetical protein